ncbi:hypothetical protein G647_09040 [Cladophialophora carrionii CBS 160.54]|uniref:Uncharacterized protein n=1 Tax=Cladophialophora carrionii CBS 160.54 TaxID=1279043 RepID=V9CZG3_9EURO|nr:uncharacterized protein G647_09040 [Cladophialophora carrionii CBS 160.54]ETI20025.1 hypothetical protein G647_09040 [Cladophialophora carrionii CBS 160.54]
MYFVPLDKGPIRNGLLTHHSSAFGIFEQVFLQNVTPTIIHHIQQIDNFLREMKQAAPKMKLKVPEIAHAVSDPEIAGSGLVTSSNHYTKSSVFVRRTSVSRRIRRGARARRSTGTAS